jgi:hypothetical protein
VTLSELCILLKEAWRTATIISRLIGCARWLLRLFGWKSPQSPSCDPKDEVEPCEAEPCDHPRAWPRPPYASELAARRAHYADFVRRVSRSKDVDTVFHYLPIEEYGHE